MQTLEKKSAISLSLAEKQESTVPELKSESMLEGVLDVAIVGNCSESWFDKMGKDEPPKRQKLADCQATVESILEEVLSKIVMSRGYPSQQDREKRPKSQEVGIWYLSCNFHPINCLD